MGELYSRRSFLAGALTAVQVIPSSTQDQFDKFNHTSADIFNLDVIHIPRFAAEGRIRAFAPQNDISLLPPLRKVCAVDGSDSRFWAVPWNADIGMLYRRVTSRTSSVGEPGLKEMLSAPPGQFVGQLDTVGSQTDEA